MCIKTPLCRENRRCRPRSVSCSNTARERNSTGKKYVFYDPKEKGIRQKSKIPGEESVCLRRRKLNINWKPIARASYVIRTVEYLVLNEPCGSIMESKVASAREPLIPQHIHRESRQHGTERQWAKLNSPVKHSGKLTNILQSDGNFVGFINTRFSFLKNMKITRQKKHVLQFGPRSVVLVNDRNYFTTHVVCHLECINLF